MDFEEELFEDIKPFDFLWGWMELNKDTFFVIYTLC